MTIVGTFRLSRHWSPSVVLISVNRLLDLSSSAYSPNGILARHSNFMMCILERRCLARWPWILNAMLQSEHLKGLGSEVDVVGEELNCKKTVRGAVESCDATVRTLLWWLALLSCFMRCPLVLKLMEHVSHLYGLSK